MNDISLLSRELCSLVNFDGYVETIVKLPVANIASSDEDVFVGAITNIIQINQCVQRERTECLKCSIDKRHINYYEQNSLICKNAFYHPHKTASIKIS